MSQAVRSILRICSQLRDILSPRQKIELVVLFFTMLLEAGLELLGVALIYPFVNLIENESVYVDNPYLGWIYRLGINSHNGYIFFLGMLIICVFLAKNAIAVLCVYYRLDYAKRFKIDISNEILRSYLGRGYEFFLNTNSSVIQRSLTEDVIQLYELITRALEMAAAIVTSIVLGIYLIILEPTIAIGELLIISLCFLFVTVVFKNKIKNAGKNYRKSYADLIKCNNQIVGGIKELLLFGRKSAAAEQFSNFAMNEGKARLIDMLFQSCPDRFIEFSSIGGFIAIVCFRLSQGVAIDTIVPILAAFALAAFKVLNNVSKIATRINAIVYRQASLNDCHANLMEIKQHARISPSQGGVNQIVLSEFASSLSVDSVCWKYQGVDREILHDVSFTINKGESVAFIGASGSGKSTLVNILLGLLRPQNGHVFLDGLDITSRNVSLKGIVGYVPQSVFLIDDTIKANVAFMLPDSSISDEQVWDALEKAQLGDFVRSLPDGLDTIVGERGIKFSGGQSQRISIARALFDNPDILVLDEATSNLDTDTESAVMDAIDALRGVKTLIIIAHRLSTIRNCDTIYEISNGTVTKKNPNSA